jgi:pilus assembly protein CpaF
MNLTTLLQFFPEPLREVIVSPDVSDIMINADGGVFVERHGTLERVWGLDVNPRQVCVGLETIARHLGGDIDAKRPILDTRLPDGSRVAAVYNVANKAMTVTIRKFNRWFSTDELISFGSMTSFVRDALVNAILGRRGYDAANILVSGGTGAGKSTLAKALLDHVPETERLIVIEKPRELAISHENAVRWEAVDAAPGGYPVTIAQLLVAALRHRPDRIIIGEVREPASAYELLQAMNTGHSGTLSTIHADSAMDALHRLADLALASHGNLTHEFVRQQVARTINYVVHVSRIGGRRRVTECGFIRDRRKFEIERIYSLESERESDF